MSQSLKPPGKDRPDHEFHFTTAGLAVVAALLSSIVNAVLPFAGIVLGVAIVLTGLRCIGRPRVLRFWRLKVPMGMGDSLWWVAVGGMVIVMGYLRMRGIPVETLLQH
jgi:hypothetical protein